MIQQQSTFPNKTIVVVAIIVLFGLVTIFTSLYQNTINYLSIPIMDGYKYLQISEWLSGQDKWPPIHFPFSTRVGYPFIINLLGTHISNGYFIANTIFNFLIFLAFTFIFVKSDKTSLLLPLLAIWTLFHWMGPVRQQALDPVSLDSPTWFFLIIIAFLLVYNQWIYLALVLVLFSFIKELALALAIILFTWAFFFSDSRKAKWSLFLTIISCFVVLSLLKIMFPAQNGEGRNSVITVAFHIRELILHPQKILFWIAAFFSSWGFWWIPFISKFRLSTTKTSLFFLLAGLLILSFTGGDDYTRLTMMGLPVMFIIYSSLTDYNPKIILTIFTLSIPFCRLDKWLLPNPEANWQEYASMFPEYSGFPITLFLIAYGFAGTLYILYLFKSDSLKESSSTSIKK